MDKAGSSGVEKSAKEEWKEKVEKVKKGPVKSQSGLVFNNRWEKQVGDGNPEYVPESIMNMQQGLRLSMVDKENIQHWKAWIQGRFKILTMFKLLVWNSRGAASKGFAAVVKDMQSRHKLDVVVILEPRVSGIQASRIIKNWGFRHSVRVEADGFSGGIRIVWRRDDLNMAVITKDEQFIHCKIGLDGEEMLFSAVYASPCEEKRRRLWRFNDWIQDCGFIDVDAKGPFFTWKGPKWEGLDRVYKRLDRCLCNILWLEKFENAEVRVSPRVCSDHHPLLIKLNVENKGFRRRNFRYEAMWQMHERFEEVMKQSWRGNDEAHVKLITLQQDLTTWNKEVFGHVEVCAEQRVQSAKF
ncbi:hypothetical protein K1719_042396 [Acacia pycnantha]|nr:hypothetical protein K1719_042396 [Acacia pycnantha]